MNKPELLAPAGTFEKAKVAFMYGADAVYAGTSKLSLRTRTSMEFDDLINTVKLAHSLNKKVYVAMNVYARDEEYELVKKEAAYLDEIGVDGLIVADGGIAEIVKEYAPNTELHISTQANVVSLHACNFWYKNGANRVILARELSKDEIKHITKNKPNGLDIEMFVHGAICYSYSGRCYMSDYMAGRSANHGDCAQPCRWAYNLYVEEKNNPGQMMPVEHDDKGTYIFSSKDLCLINDMPTIFDLGVDSLKIEGRLKTEYYLATVVNAYRHAIDDYAANPENWSSEKYMKELDKARTRGLTTFYFNEKYNPDIQDYDGKQINPDYEFGGVVISTDLDGITTIEIRNKLKIGDTLEIMIPEKLEPITFVIDKLYDAETNEEIEAVNPGVKEQKVKLILPVDVSKGYIIRRIK
ncbi:MAG: U32 family peptidase [Clostridia bacterium]|nr:U32 family peptidase [Clostridia bacterium]